MRYVKLINNDIEELNPNYIKIDGNVYTNPINNPNVDLKALGYKELVIIDMPSYEIGKEKVIRFYREDKDKIYRDWKVQAMTEQEIEEYNRMRIGE